MSTEPRFLIVDGYSKQGREELEKGGATPAGVLYHRMLEGCHPGCIIDTVHPADAGDELPEGTALAHYDGITWTGSSLTVYKEDDEMVRRQIAFAQAAFAAGVPQFGSCWAAQIAVTAAGGLCARNPAGRELGIARKIQLTAAGCGHPMYEGKPAVFGGFISHDDEITHLPASAVRLAGNRFTRVQAVSVSHRGGTMWAVQYHPEYNLHELARLMFCRRQALVKLGLFQDEEGCKVFTDNLETVHWEPGRRDLAWQLGVDEDVMDEDVRQLEVRNWIRHQVLPGMRA